MTHDYKRHGTTTLFAALNVLDGSVVGKCMRHHRHDEWLALHSPSSVSPACHAGSLNIPRYTPIRSVKEVLFDEIRYFFYITNDVNLTADEIVHEARQRCNQENSAGRLVGLFGRAAREACDDFFELGLVHIVASDAHSTARRPPQSGRGPGVGQEELGNGSGSGALRRQPGRAGRRSGASVELMV